VILCENVPLLVPTDGDLSSTLVHATGYGSFVKVLDKVHPVYCQGGEVLYDTKGCSENSFMTSAVVGETNVMVLLVCLQVREIGRPGGVAGL
jgi:hypothetical protein